MVRYERLNQQRVYNLKTRKIHILSFVWFDKGFSYYDISHETTDENDKNAELGNLWNEASDNEFGKVITRKQIVGKEAIISDPNFQSKERSVIADSEKEVDNDSLLESTATNNDHRLPNQSMLLSIVSSEVLSLLIDIFGGNTPLPPAIFDEPEDKEDFLKLPNTL